MLDTSFPAWRMVFGDNSWASGGGWGEGPLEGGGYYGAGVCVCVCVCVCERDPGIWGCFCDPGLVGLDPI